MGGIGVISKNKQIKGKLDTAHNKESIYKRQKGCASCIYYEEKDKSCSLRPIIINEVGYAFYKNCGNYIEKQAKEKIKKKNYKVKKQYNVKSNDSLFVEKVKKNNRLFKIVITSANRHCELCNRESKDLDVYYIDNNRFSGSVLNMAVLCLECKDKVRFNKEQYNDILKEIATKRLSKLV